MAMHESQSLLMESLVCCSQAFYQFLEPDIQQHFGFQEALRSDNLYKLATRVKPGLIRVNADEVSYQLHIILRYELEKELLKGTLPVADLPSYWNTLMTQYLGISTENDYQNGVMQDVHWPAGAFGYFPAYTLGRLIGAQFFSSFLSSHPQFFEQLKQGNFQTLRQWLQHHIYSQGSALSTEDLVRQVTGKSLDAGYFVSHLQRRYLEECA
jgi:carboxypeptidase Taq